MEFRKPSTRCRVRDNVEDAPGDLNDSKPFDVHVGDVHLSILDWHALKLNSKGMKYGGDAYKGRVSFLRKHFVEMLSVQVCVCG